LNSDTIKCIIIFLGIVFDILVSYVRKLCGSVEHLHACKWDQDSAMDQTRYC